MRIRDIRNVRALTFERSDVLDQVVFVLREGGVVALSTDTVHGLIADAANEKAVWKIFEIKGRPEEKALPVFVSGVAMAKEYAEISSEQERFLEKVWGVDRCETTNDANLQIRSSAIGKVTAVLKVRDDVQLCTYVMKDETIGMRAPKDKFLQKVLMEMGVPLAQSSANVSGKPAARSAEEVWRYFKDRKEQPEIVVQGGRVSGGSSTVVDLSGDRPKILREGAVSRDALSHFLRDSGFLGVAAL